MRKKLRKPVKLLNDADVQGLAVIKGKGLELVCTLGTGFGTAWFRDGELMPHMDLAHLAMHRKDDFDAMMGDTTRRKIGNQHWNKRIKKLIAVLDTVFNYDHLYLGGGNSPLRQFQVAAQCDHCLQRCGHGRWRLCLERPAQRPESPHNAIRSQIREPIAGVCAFRSHWIEAHFISRFEARAATTESLDDAAGQ